MSELSAVASKKSRFRIEKLEERIAPACMCMMGHNRGHGHNSHHSSSQSQFQSQFQSQSHSQSQHLSISIRIVAVSGQPFTFSAVM